MTKKDFIQHWNYYCSLTTRLNETKNYVYHGVDGDEEEKKLIHGSVYSDSFKQILLLAAAEFEIIARAICSEDEVDVSNIVGISTTILSKYPRIINTEVDTLFWQSRPLQEWSVENNIVSGLDWWKAYNSLKHNEADSFMFATLDNAANALAALYILNLYLMFIVFEDLSIAHYYPCEYFRCKYTADTMIIEEGKLPDFGNKSAEECFHEYLNEVFKI